MKLKELINLQLRETLSTTALLKVRELLKVY